jgi:hypothetical protein
MARRRSTDLNTDRTRLRSKLERQIPGGTSMKIETYQVVDGYLASMPEVRAITAAGHQQKDGWYYLPDGECDGFGPYRSKEAAEEAFNDDRLEGC